MLQRRTLLLGGMGVGKTAIFRRITGAPFTERYLPTVVVQKSELSQQDTLSQLELWDLTGEMTVNKIPMAYLKVAALILYVYDLSRPPSKAFLSSELKSLKSLAPDCPVLVIGNKLDLIKENTANWNPVKRQTDLFLSAKTLENLEHLSEKLTHQFI